MIDRDARIQINCTIPQYLNCEIDNQELDELISQRPTNDRLCNEIIDQVWLLYDDFKRHRNEGKWKIPSEVEVTIRRWIRLLESDVEWDEIRPKTKTSVSRTFLHFILKLKNLFHRPYAEIVLNKFWPFADEQQWILYDSKLPIVNEKKGSAK
jgi:hypothetical protein